MEEQAQFPDDISALWGPDDAGTLEPAPLRTGEPHPPRAAPPSNGSGNGTRADTGADDRLAAIERQLRLLADSLKATRSAPVDPGSLGTPWTGLHVDLAEIRADILHEVDMRLRASEAQGREPAHDLAGRVAEEMAATTQRLADLEKGVQHGLARLTAAMEAHELEPVGRHRARTIRDELQREFTEQLAAVRTAAEEAVERQIATADERFDRRLDDEVPARVAAAGEERVAALERETVRLAESIEVHAREAAGGSDLDALRTELVALARTLVVRVEARLNERLDGLARHVASGPSADDVERIADLEQEISRLDARRDDLEASIEGRVAAVEAASASQLADLTDRSRELRAGPRIEGLEREAARLAEAIEAQAREAVREPRLEALRADLQAAAEAAASGAEARVTARVDELAGQLTELAATAGPAIDRVTVLEHTLARLGDALRDDLGSAIESKLAALEAESASQLADVTDRLRAAAPTRRIEGLEREIVRLAAAVEECREEAARTAEVEAVREELEIAARAAVDRAVARLGKRLAGKVQETPPAARPRSRPARRPPTPPS